eukprot:TRINITY_DN23548_c0_g1_i1.p2 TRINITY_DN23548_c0_g1~~TRINITY_DN23548_c0_g1_i1.p2  ORF type:complete len:179 (-),score=41.99 TRINITY_DN23548_c0_g1_i1:339-875(-)
MSDPVPTSRAEYPVHECLRWSHPAAYDYLKKSALRKEKEASSRWRQLMTEAAANQGPPALDVRCSSSSSASRSRSSGGLGFGDLPYARPASTASSRRMGSASGVKALEVALQRQTGWVAKEKVDPRVLLSGVKRDILRATQVSEDDFRAVSGAFLQDVAEAKHRSAAAASAAAVALRA